MAPGSSPPASLAAQLLEVRLLEIRNTNELLKEFLDAEAALKAAMLKTQSPAERKQLSTELEAVRLERARLLTEEQRAAQEAAFISATCAIDLPKGVLTSFSAAALTTYQATVSRLVQKELLIDASKWGVQRVWAERAMLAIRNAGRFPAARTALLAIGISTAALAAYEKEAEDVIRQKLESSSELQTKFRRFCGG